MISFLLSLSLSPSVAVLWPFTHTHTHTRFNKPVRFLRFILSFSLITVPFYLSIHLSLSVPPSVPSFLSYTACKKLMRLLSVGADTYEERHFWLSSNCEYTFLQKSENPFGWVCVWFHLFFFSTREGGVTSFLAFFMSPPPLSPFTYLHFFHSFLNTKTFQKSLLANTVKLILFQVNSFFLLYLFSFSLLFVCVSASRTVSHYSRMPREA